jgi:hypothetical protein
MKRPHGAGRLYVKWGSYYGRWRMPDGRYLNRRIGAVRQRGSSDGLTKSQAEAALRRLVEQESRRRPPAAVEHVRSVDEVIDVLRDRLVIQGARTSYQQNCESMQRIHISPAIGSRRIDDVTRDDVERLARSMLGRGLSPKTLRNVMSFLYSTFALAQDRDWVEVDPVARATRPLRRRRDATADLQFLTVEELDAVLEAIPDEVVLREPAPTRKGAPRVCSPAAARRPGAPTCRWTRA